MKYLVIANLVTGAQEHRSHSSLLRAAKEWVKAKRSDGTLDFIYSFISGGGLFIVNANSHDELMKLLVEFPLRPFSEIEVHALCDFNQTLDASIEAVEKVSE